jgi:hypothetical protein
VSSGEIGSLNKILVLFFYGNFSNAGTLIFWCIVMRGAPGARGYGFWELKVFP